MAPERLRTDQLLVAHVPSDLHIVILQLHRQHSFHEQQHTAVADHCRAQGQAAGSREAILTLHCTAQEMQPLLAYRVADDRADCVMVLMLRMALMWVPCTGLQLLVQNLVVNHTHVMAGEYLCFEHDARPAGL